MIEQTAVALAAIMSGCAVGLTYALKPLTAREGRYRRAMSHSEQVIKEARERHHQFMTTTNVQLISFDKRLRDLSAKVETNAKTQASMKVALDAHTQAVKLKAESHFDWFSVAKDIQGKTTSAEMMRQQYEQNWPVVNLPDMFVNSEPRTAQQQRKVREWPPKHMSGVSIATVVVDEVEHSKPEPPPCVDIEDGRIVRDVLHWTYYKGAWYSGEYIIAQNPKSKLTLWHRGKVVAEPSWGLKFLAQLEELKARAGVHHYNARTRNPKQKGKEL